MVRFLPPITSSDEAFNDVFTFTAGPKPAFLLKFARSSSPRPAARRMQSESRKRGRPLADVDGDYHGITRTKKRRLRLFLITSRLSRPFSSPPTHIIDRGYSKIAVWAKQKSLGRNLLRKAAIMNRVKKLAIAAREVEQKQLELARQAFMSVLESSLLQPHPRSGRPADTSYSRHHASLVQIPRRQYIPLPPSPLGLSNYAALDLEDDIYDDDDDDCNGERPTLYSDFNILEPSESVVLDYDSLEHLNDPLQQSQKPPAPIPPDERMAEIMREKERQKELCFLPFGVV